MVASHSFVMSSDDGIDDYVSGLLEGFVRDILDVLRPRSIVLHGSLSRGEGTAINGPDGPTLVSDFEIGVVSRDVTKLGRIRRLGKKLQRSGADVTLSFFLPRRFTNLVASNWALPSRLMTLEQYELLSSLKVLYGDDPRSGEVVVSPSLIMPWDALRLIFNRVAELLEKLTEDPLCRVELVKTFNKLLIACGDATLLLTGEYHYSYSERRSRLQRLLERPTTEGWPDGVDWVTVLSAYDWKLNPSNGDAANVELDTMVSSSLIPVLRFCTSKLLGWSFEDIGEFRSRYVSSSELRNLSRAFAGHPLAQNLLLMTKRFLSQRQLHVRLSLWKTLHETYAYLPCALVSLCQGRRVTGQSVIYLEPALDDEARSRIAKLLGRWRELGFAL